MKILVAVSSVMEYPVWRESLASVFAEQIDLESIQYAQSAAQLKEIITENKETPFDLLIVSSDIEGANGVVLLETLKLTSMIDVSTYCVANTSMPESSFYSKSLIHKPDLLIPQPVNVKLVTEGLKIARDHIASFSEVRRKIASKDCIASNQCEEAILMLLDLINAGADECWAYQMIAHLMACLGRNSEAIGLLTKIANKRANCDGFTLSLIGHLLLDNRYDEIITLLTNREKEGADLLCYFYCLSMCYEKVGDLSKASYYLARAERLNFALPDEKLLASILHERAGEMEEAVKAQLDAIQKSKGTHVHCVDHYDRLTTIANKYWNNTEGKRCSGHIIANVTRTLSHGSELFKSKMMKLQSKLFEMHVHQLNGNQRSLDKCISETLDHYEAELVAWPGCMQEVITVLSLSNPEDKVLNKLVSNASLDRLSLQVGLTESQGVKNHLEKSQKLLLRNEINEAEYHLLRVIARSPKHVTANVRLMKIYEQLYKSTHNTTHLESAYRHLESIHPVDARHILFKEYHLIKTHIQEHSLALNG